MKVPAVKKLAWVREEDGIWRAGPVSVWRARIRWNLHYSDFDGKFFTFRGFRTPLAAMRYAERLRSLNEYVFHEKHVAMDRARKGWEAEHGRIVMERIRLVGRKSMKREARKAANCG